jgi:IS30 family transposase
MRGRGLKTGKEMLTLDNSSKFAAHTKINKRHSIDVFFAKQYASWQKGKNKNTNGRLRRIWPKKLIWRLFLKMK